MACNDLISLQKSPLFNLRTQHSEHYLNPFGQLLFCQSWKWNQHHQLLSKSKYPSISQNPSLKKDILTWFENLNDTQKIAVTSISTLGFAESFCKLVAHRHPHRLFNLRSERWVDGVAVGKEQSFFEYLLQQLRIAYLAQPVLYFKNAKIMDIRMLDWLNKVSSSRVFQYASKTKKDEENPLWFSRVSYRYLQDWLANEIQIAIVKNFFNKSVPEFLVTLLQNHIKSTAKNETLGLSFTILQAQKKSKCQVNIIKAKLKQEEEKFLEFRQLKLIKSMELIQESARKKNKKKAKKKTPKIDVINQQKLPEENIKTKETTVLETDTTNSPLVSIEKELALESFLTHEAQEDKPTALENSQDLKLQIKPTKQMKDVEQTKRSSRTKNLIKISPKRTHSPEHARRQKIFDSQQIKEKYSEQQRERFMNTEDQKSSEPAFSLEEPSLFEKTVEKKRRKRGKKENEKLIEVKELLFSKFICRQIDNLVDQLGIQTNALYNHKIISFQRIRTFVQSLYPTANAILFGSNAIGLSLPNSDVDILLTGLNCCCKEQASEVLAQIAVQINAMGWVVSCSTYLNAKVPIVKLQIDTCIPFLQTKRKQDLFRVYNPALLYHLDYIGESECMIKADITINVQGVTSVGYESTVLMRDWILKLPILQKLLLLMKYILSYQGYNSNFTGGIGSYCLFVMVAAYIKQKGQEKEGDECKQLLNILKWYGQDFDNHNNVVWLREEGTCFFHEQMLNLGFQEGKRGLLKLIDPITGRFMNSSCNQYNNIKIQFRRIYEELNGFKDLIQKQLRLGNVSAPELIKIVQSKKSIDKWLNRFEQKHSLGLRGVIQRTNN